MMALKAKGHHDGGLLKIMSSFRKQVELFHHLETELKS